MEEWYGPSSHGDDTDLGASGQSGLRPKDVIYGNLTDHLAQIQQLKENVHKDGNDLADPQFDSSYLLVACSDFLMLGQEKKTQEKVARLAVDMIALSQPLQFCLDMNLPDGQMATIDMRLNSQLSENQKTDEFFANVAHAETLSKDEAATRAQKWVTKLPDASQWVEQIKHEFGCTREKARNLAAGFLAIVVIQEKKQYSDGTYFINKKTDTGTAGYLDITVRTGPGLDADMARSVKVTQLFRM